MDYPMFGQICQLLHLKSYFSARSLQNSEISLKYKENTFHLIAFELCKNLEQTDLHC